MQHTFWPPTDPPKVRLFTPKFVSKIAVEQTTLVRHYQAILKGELLMTDAEIHPNSGAVRISGHAITRAAQRGVHRDVIRLLLAFGDLELPAAMKRRRLRLSRGRAAELMTEGYSFRLVDSAQKVELILGKMDRVVTVIRCDPYPTRRSMFLSHRHASVRI
jgi:hypothetical protein